MNSRNILRLHQLKQNVIVQTQQLKSRTAIRKWKHTIFLLKIWKKLERWYGFGATSAASNTSTVAYFNENYFPVQHKKKNNTYTSTQYGKRSKSAPDTVKQINRIEFTTEDVAKFQLLIKVARKGTQLGRQQNVEICQ